MLVMPASALSTAVRRSDPEMVSTTADVHARKRAEERNGSRTKRTWCGTGVDMEGLTRIELASSVWKLDMGKNGMAVHPC